MFVKLLQNLGDFNGGQLVVIVVWLFYAHPVPIVPSHFLLFFLKCVIVVLIILLDNI